MVAVHIKLCKIFPNTGNGFIVLFLLQPERNCIFLVIWGNVNIAMAFYLFIYFFMATPRLEKESELQLPAYATATATWDLSHICDVHHSSWQCQILNPLSEAKDRTHILMDTIHVHYR